MKIFRKKKYLDQNRVFESCKIDFENHKIEELKKNKKLQKLKGNTKYVNRIRRFEPEELLPELR